MIVRTMLAAATVLMAAWTPASAQSGESGQSVRDILNRAQTQSERKAVEDLIGKLRTNQPTAAPQQAPQAPAAAADSQPAAAPSVAAPAAPPAAVPSAPATVAQPDPAVAPAAAPPVAVAPAAAPPVAASPAIAAPSVPQQPPTAQPTAVSQPASREPAAPTVGAATPADPAPAAVTPVSAPTGRAARENRRASRPGRQAPADAAANDTAPMGAPIGPAEALPTPIGPSEAEMARAPEIARERGLPTVDIEVLFAYDSNEISPAAAESLKSLGGALADPRLAGQKFVIAGHTDAKGAATYNLGLSDRRAQAVRTFLIEQFKIAPDNLIARGFGETRLKNPRNPLGPENRRVQIINWTGQTVDQRRR